MPNSVDPDQTAPIGAVCSGSTLFASVLNSSVIIGKYLQQTTFSDAFFLGASRVQYHWIQTHNSLKYAQGLHRLEKYLNLEGFFEKSLKMKSAMKSTGKSLKSLEKSLNSTIFCRTKH